MFHIVYYVYMYAEMTTEPFTSKTDVGGVDRVP